MADCNVVCRMNAENMLLHRISKQEKIVTELKLIRDKIDWRALSDEEDEILWDFFAHAWN